MDYSISLFGASRTPVGAMTCAGIAAAIAAGYTLANHPAETIGASSIVGGSVLLFYGLGYIVEKAASYTPYGRKVAAEIENTHYFDSIPRAFVPAARTADGNYAGKLNLIGKSDASEVEIVAADLDELHLKSRQAATDAGAKALCVWNQDDGSVVTHLDTVADGGWTRTHEGSTLDGLSFFRTLAALNQARHDRRTVFIDG